MSHGKNYLLRNLIPKSYHFDGYNELNCMNTRDRPFFAENVIPLGNYYLTTRFDGSGNLILEFSSVCPNGNISFKPYKLSFESFVTRLKECLEEDSDFIIFDIQTNYHHFTNCEYCNNKNRDCSSILKSRPAYFKAAVSFNQKDIKNALSVYFGINKPQSFKGGHDMNMKGNKTKNLFGMNFELGMSKDRNIASTLMGIAVKNAKDGNWYVFDSNKKSLTNIGNMKMGNFPILLLPTPTLAVGDLTKRNGEYYYVQSVEQNSVKLIGAADGVITDMLLSESIIPGMNLYTKVSAFDVNTLSDPTSKQNVSGNILAAMCLMGWNDDEAEFSLDHIDDNSFNGLGKFWPLLMASGGTNGLGNIFGNESGGLNLPLLMAMGSGNSSDEANSIAQVMLLGQIFGNGNSGGNTMFGNIPGITSATSMTTTAEEVFCPTCKENHPSDVKFCPKCGTPTVVKGKTCTCGATLKDGAAFCHICGKKVQIDTCPKCGTKTGPDANFCPSCGTSLKEDVAVTAPAANVEAPAVSKE